MANYTKSMYGVDRLAERMKGTEMELFDDNDAQSIKVCDIILNSRNDPVLEYIVHGNEAHFDLVINNLVLGDCGLIVAHKYRAKLIISASTAFYSWLYDEYGFPDEPATIPEMTRFLSFFPFFSNYIRN